MSFSGTIVISHNPVTSWERYSRTFDPGGFSGFHPETRAQGGYYRCRLNLHGGREFLSEFLSNGLGRDLAAFDPRGEQIWEGFIHGMTLDAGGARIQINLEEVYNKVWIRYRLTGTTTTVRSTPTEDLVSQDRFGIKDFVLTGGELESAAVANQIAQSYLNLHAQPKPTPSRIGIGGSRPARGAAKIEIEARGYWDTLKWRVYNQTGSSGNQGISAEVGDIVTAVGQFIAGTKIDVNSTLVTKVYDQDRFAGDILEDLARVGDVSYRRYILQVGNGRILKFGQAAPATILVV